MAKSMYHSAGAGEDELTFANPIAMRRPPPLPPSHAHGMSTADGLHIDDMQVR
jgi:hypothetical protein